MLFTSPGPDIFHIGSFTLRWYGLLIALAVLIGVNFSIFLAKKRRMNSEAIGDLAIWLVVAAIPCARLYFVLFNWNEYQYHLGDIVAVWKGGIAIHGAIIGGILATIAFSKFKKISFWSLADVVVPSVALGQAIGRWGNFFNSEAFGSPTNLPWKPPEFQDVEYFHPTFLYESLWNLGVFGILMLLFFRSLSARKPLKDGTLFLLYLVIYSLGRVWIEGLRTDSLMFGSLRMAQVISLAGVAAGSLVLVWLYRQRSKVPISSGPDNPNE
jgi:phosphatidylglycerol---prolipoprotein diacylglyceryl transferase